MPFYIVNMSNLIQHNKYPGRSAKYPDDCLATRDNGRDNRSNCNGGINGCRPRPPSWKDYLIINAILPRTMTQRNESES